MIKNILLVGAGGALGSVARYLLTYILTQLAICSEIATVAINVVGSFAIGMAISALGNMGYLFAAGLPHFLPSRFKHFSYYKRVNDCRHLSISPHR